MPSLIGSRIFRIIAATALIFALWLNSPSSSPLSRDPQPPPSPEEVAVLEELLSWIGSADAASGYRLRGEADIASAVRSRPRSFELFRSYNPRTVRREHLRTLPYGEIIRRAADRHRLDGLLIAAVIEAESSFDAEAVSPDGAFGLMQIMPDTAGLFGVPDYQEPAVNVDLGARYLSQLLRQFDGDLVLAVAAYNAGPGNVARFRGVPPFPETRRYVSRVLSRYVDHHQSVWQKAGASGWLL